MSNLVVPYSDIFKARRYDESCRFVYIMQALQRHSARKQDYPLDSVSIVDTDAIWLLAYDIRYLQTIHRYKADAALPLRARKKYERTWKLLLKQYSGFLSVLEESNFDPKAISSSDWSDPLERIGTPRGFFG